MIHNWLKERLLENRLQAEFRGANKSRYKEAFGACDYQMVDYDPLMMDYQIAYMESAGWVAEDCSVTLMSDGRVAALAPLIVFQKDRERLLSSSTVDVFPPVFVAGVARNVKKHLTKHWHDVVQRLAVEMAVGSWRAQENFHNQQGLSDWHHLLMMEGAQLTVTHDWYVDLSLDLDKIRAHVRARYKSLINKASRLWKIRVATTADGQKLWSDFHALHAFVAGRETRSSETWDLQWEAIIRGHGLLISLFDAEDRMVGGGFFHTTRDEGIYAVGAYDRALFDRPLGHVVQYRAIQELKSRGVRWYRVGRQYYMSDTPTPSDKERSISRFKSGFATHLFPVFRALNRVK